MDSLSRSIRLSLIVAVICCLPGTAAAAFLVPAWRGTSDATWYLWANPYGMETPLIPISTGNFYNGSFGGGGFTPDTFRLSVPSFLQSGSAGTIWLQVRGSLGESNSFISTPRLTVGSGSAAWCT